jgi:hypothetical protein
VSIQKAKEEAKQMVASAARVQKLTEQDKKNINGKLSKDYGWLMNLRKKIAGEKKMLGKLNKTVEKPKGL